MTTIHPQIITKNNMPEFVVLPYQEYESLLDALEDKEDIKAIQEFHAGDSETIPFELLKTITNKEGNAVRVFRKFRNLSQAKLASQAGISRQYLCQIESNQRQGSSRTLKKIADILKIDIDLLITDSL